MSFLNLECYIKGWLECFTDVGYVADCGKHIAIYSTIQG